MPEDLLSLSSRLLSGELSMKDRPPVSILGSTELTEVADGIGFVESFANVVALRADAESSGRGSSELVLVDAASPFHATAVHSAIRDWTQAPLSAVVFTHGHVDHVGGVGEFEAEADAGPVRVIAHENLPLRFDRYSLTSGYNGIINQRQFQLGAPLFPTEFRYPDQTYVEQFSLPFDGGNLELFHDKGETDDATWVWSPERRVVDALDEAFKLAFGNVEPTGKRMMLALDVSGSMCSPVPGTTISCREASAAMALITCATEANCSVVAFGAQLTPVAMKGDMTVTQAVRVSDMSFGRTDCALPMLHALKNGIAVDCFVVYTDSETYFGSVHPQVALQQYRAATGIQAKLVVVGMVSNSLTIADPSDPHTLNLAGFDTSSPEVLSMFARGEL